MDENRQSFGPLRASASLRSGVSSESKTQNRTTTPPDKKKKQEASIFDRKPIWFPVVLQEPMGSQHCAIISEPVGSEIRGHESRH